MADVAGGVIAAITVIGSRIDLAVFDDVGLLVGVGFFLGLLGVEGSGS
jgi:hypothetical protein